MTTGETKNKLIPIQYSLTSDEKCRGEGDQNQNIVAEVNLNNVNADNAVPKCPNIRLALFYTILIQASRSMWSQSVLSTFVFLLRDESAESVGYATAAMGISQLVVSLPVGHLADRYRRDTMLKIASVIGFISVSLSILATWKENYLLFTAALSSWGAYWGTANTSILALYSDSIREGERSKYFTQRSMLQSAGNILGPTTTLVLFAILGDKWKIRECIIVITVGNMLSFPALVLLCFFRDYHADEEDDINKNPLKPFPTPVSIDGAVDENQKDSLFKEEGNIGSRGDGSWSVDNKWKISVMVALADLIAGFAAGMSISFFPIFFLQDLNLSPVVVQVLYIIQSLGSMGLKYCSQVVSRRFGRVFVTICFKWFGIFLMITMVLSFRLGWPVWTTCLFYLLRTLFMNCTAPLTRSVLMDSVSKENRGKWSAIESVHMFSWSGSAVLGGLIVGWRGVLCNFTITAGMQFCATLPLLTLELGGHDPIEKNKNDVNSEKIRNDVGSKNNVKEIV